MKDGLVIILAIAGIFLFSIKKAKDTVTGAVNYLEDAAANTIIGGFIGLRTVAASEASAWIKGRIWLKNEYRNWLLMPPNSFAAKYNLARLGDQAASDIAAQIIDSNTLLPLGIADNPMQAVNAIMRINNIVQALEVNFWYYSNTGKNLSAGLQWLPNDAIVAAYDHLKTMSVNTGVFDKNTNIQLTKLPIPS